MHAGRHPLAPVLGLALLACIEEPDLEGRRCDTDGSCPAPLACNEERRCVRTGMIAPDASGVLVRDALVSDGTTDPSPMMPDAGTTDSTPADDALAERSDAALEADGGPASALDGEVSRDAASDASVDASSNDAAPPDGMAADSSTAEFTESNASNWGAGSSPYAWSDSQSPRCMAQLLLSGTSGIDSTGITVSDDTNKRAEGASSIVVNTMDLGFTFFWFYPRTIDAAMDLSQVTEIEIFIDASNPGPVGWQGSFPAIYLCSSTGSFRELHPSANLLPSTPSSLTQLVIPIAGGTSGAVSWIANDGGPSAFDPSSVDWIELEADTWDFPPTTVWIDGFRFR